MNAPIKDVGGDATIRSLDDALRQTGGSFRVIRGQCHAIVRAARRPQELIDRLQTIEREVARLAQSLERTRRSLSGEPERPVPGQVDILQVVRDAMHRFGGAAAERGVALHLCSDDSGHTVHADPEAVHRLVDRIVEDAVDDALPGANVTLVVTRGPDHSWGSDADQGHDLGDIRVEWLPSTPADARDAA